MQDQDPQMPKIEFPCDYPIKVIGEVEEGAVAKIIQVVRIHAAEVTPDQVSTRASRNGNFQSIRVSIVATGEEQLKQLHTDLLQLDCVRLVL